MAVPDNSSYSRTSFPIPHARDFPPGEKVSDNKRPSPSIARSSFPEAASHTRQSHFSTPRCGGLGQSCPRCQPQSQLPLATILPSAENATALIQSLCPPSDRRSSPLWQSQSLTALSPPTLASVALPGEAA